LTLEPSRRSSVCIRRYPYSTQTAAESAIPPDRPRRSRSGIVGQVCARLRSCTRGS
jgi:hypothetical protein